MPVFLPGESSWTEEPGGLQSMGSQRVTHDSESNTHTQWRQEERPRLPLYLAPQKRPPGRVLATLTLMVLCGLRPMSRPPAVMMLPQQWAHFTVHEIFQARVLEWGAIAFSHIYSQACLNH